MKETGNTANKPAASDRGFTLIEVSVAVFIIAIVLLAVYRLHSQTLSMNFSAQFYTMAPLLAQKKLAEIEMTELEELSDESGEFGEDFPGYTWEFTIGDVELELLKTTVDNFKKIDLKISFNQDELEFSVRTYRYFQ